MTWLITLAYAIAVMYPSFELTRYILAWHDLNGQFPPGESAFSFYQAEIAFIWFTYLTGVALVAALCSRTRILK